MLFKQATGAIKAACKTTLFNGAFKIDHTSATSCKADSNNWLTFSGDVSVTLEIVNTANLQAFSIEYECK